MENKIHVNDTEIVTTEIDSGEGNLASVEQGSKAQERSHHREHRHGSHHHSHHGHHHRRHRNSTHKKKQPIILNAKLMWALTITLLVVLIIVVMLFEVNSTYQSGDQEPKNDTISSDLLSVEVTNGEGLLVKKAVEKYLLTDLLNSYYSNVLPSDFSQNEGRLDAQVPVTLKLSTKDSSAISYKIELADNSSFQNARISYLETMSGTYEFEHLYSNTEYFYRVTVYTGKGSAVQIGSFKTSDTPRILSIDGLSNVRDIGNWRTDSGKRIKQGLLIRGTEMDGAVENGYHLTNEGLKDMLNVLDIKTDIDLRARTQTSMDALGARVEHRYYDMVMYGEIFTENGKEKIRMVFSDLANPDHYPIYLHCTYGRDRTGTVCYLLEAVLGVSRGDCLKDYGLSNLYIANILAVEDGLKDYEGTTLKEQAESYLLSCGVSEYQIESIRNIFLGD